MIVIFVSWLVQAESSFSGSGVFLIKITFFYRKDSKNIRKSEGSDQKGGAPERCSNQCIYILKKKLSPNPEYKDSELFREKQI